MNENEINNLSSEYESVPTSPSTDPEDDNQPQGGLTFNWFNLFVGAAIIYLSLNGGINFLSDSWRFYIYLAIVVIIHEMGHVVFGKYFGCFIQEMQVFFLSFVSYKPKDVPEGNSWRGIKWSLGVLPLGGVTVFKSRKSIVGEGEENWKAEMTPSSSPYLEDKKTWQQLLISAGGVLFNIATFFILYFTMPYMSFECYDIFRPLMVLSLILAILNILPVYPLDGGAILFSLYEMISGKKPSPGFTRTCAWIGCVFIILFFWIFPEWLNGLLDSVLSLFF